MAGAGANLMRLPPELSQWAELLQIFPKDITLSIGRIILSLYALIGPLKQKTLFGDIDPCGFQGIHNKGNLMHLLPSEWLLAEEVPDEFNRRAAFAEQLFFHPQKVEPKQALISTALFDSGVSQLGGPRIVQLALLILLARRAQTAKATFFWGILQRPELGFHQEVTADNILNLLINSRTIYDVTQDGRHAWEEQMSNLGTVTDHWEIGGAEEPVDGSRHYLTISEKPDRDNKLLLVQLSNGRLGRSCHIELPADDIAARLVRNPFQQKTTTAHKNKFQIDGSRPIRFSQHNRKIAFGTKSGLGVYPIPNSIKMPIGRPKAFHASPGERIVAFTVFKKSIRVVTYKDATLIFHRFSQNHSMEVPVLNSEFKISDENHRIAPVFFFPGRIENRAYLTDHENRLYQFRFTHGRPDAIQGPVLIDRNVIAATVLSYELVYAVRNGASAVKILSRSMASDATTTIASAVIQNGAGGDTLLGSNRVMAIRTHKNMWKLIDNERSELLAPPSGASAVGVLTASAEVMGGRRPEGDGTRRFPFLVILEKGRHRVSLLNRHGIFYLFKLTSPIARISVGQVQGLISVMTSNRELKVYSIKHDTFLLDVLPGDGP
jgi:hypothetical protein